MIETSHKEAERCCESPTATTVFIVERNRTSRCVAGAAISRVVHQTFTCLPGSRLASMIVCPLRLVLLVIMPGSTRTFAWFPGRSRLSIELLADGTGNIMDARPASTTVSYTHLRAHETPEHLVCRLLL